MAIRTKTPKHFFDVLPALVVGVAAAASTIAGLAIATIAFVLAPGLPIVARITLLWIGACLLAVGLASGPSRRPVRHMT